MSKLIEMKHKSVDIFCWLGSLDPDNAQLESADLDVELDIFLLIFNK